MVTNIKFPITISTNKRTYADDLEYVPSALHENIEIKCFYEGTAKLLVGSQTISVGAGDIVVINPFEFHATVNCSDEKEVGKYHLFMIPLNYFTEINITELDLRNLFFSQRKSFNNLFSKDKEIFQLLMLAAEEYEQKNSAYSVYIRSLLMQVFVILLRRGISYSSENSLQDDVLRSYQLIEPAVTHIRDNFSEYISVDSLAKLCKVSKHYFCRIFKTVTGKTCMEYLRDYRLTIADTFLTNTEKSIAEVAELCGFESSNYFCRCYKASFGISPGKKRNIARL